VRVELEDAGQEGGGIAVAAKTPEVDVGALPAQPKGEVLATSLAPPPGTREAPPRAVASVGARATAGTSRAASAPVSRDEVRTLPVTRTQLYVQAGAFTKSENAGRLATRLFSIAPARVVNARIDGQPYYRVRLGPLNDVAEADEALQKVVATGIADAHIVVEQ
jgi:rare lipoprotein A